MLAYVTVHLRPEGTLQLTRFYNNFRKQAEQGQELPTLARGLAYRLLQRALPAVALAWDLKNPWVKLEASGHLPSRPRPLRPAPDTAAARLTHAYARSFDSLPPPEIELLWSMHTSNRRLAQYYARKLGFEPDPDSLGDPTHLPLRARLRDVLGKITCGDE